MTKITSVEEAILKMKEEIQQHGDMHGEYCPANMEDPDECECEELEFWGNQIAKYMRSVATADRTAQLTKLRDSELLKDLQSYDSWGDGHNTLARAMKARLDELIKANSL